jgi:dihydrofolate reductase
MRKVVMVYPIVLGSGKRLFKDGTTTTLKPTGTHAFSSGDVALTYQPAGKEANK